ncbi:hypothetical protein H2198_008083 [Neophaeococcomyces mojaviensis]|uniref:Uncharacterized protein n=1 Tax=Neophaeococcomyces mojaviensis TaxID=3383035 RepID=A0ACC2ZY59_9EURO|nr:hypothetical protein H2198_008083 [Knufia sp. JES_112]
MLASIPLLVTFSLGALAQPAWGPWGNGHGAPDCLNDAKVKTILDGYTYLLESPQGADFNTTAESLLSDSFFVSSDSINTLAGYPLGVNAYPSKQAFIAGQAQTPPIPVLQTLGSFYSCDQIAWRWNGSQIGSNQYEIKGIITMDVNATTTQINAVYSEFNSGAWLSDIGNPECQKK